MFLTESATLNQKAIENILNVLDIDLGMYEKRFNLAKTIAETFKKKNIPVSDVIKMSKEKMSSECENDDILLFFDVNYQMASIIIEKGLVDYESTFVFLKAMIIHMMNSDLKFTNLAYITSWKKTDDWIRTKSGIKNVDTSLIQKIVGAAVSSMLLSSFVEVFKPSLSMPLKILSKELLTFSKHHK